MNFVRTAAVSLNAARHCSVSTRFSTSAFRSTSFCASRFYASLIVKVPPMADSITEGAFGSWEKQIGEEVKRDELVANIETDKITLPVNSPEDGVILEVYAQPGDTVAVGADLYKMEVGAKAEGKEKPAEKPVEPVVEKVVEKVAEVPKEKPAEKPVEKVAVEQVQVPAFKPINSAPPAPAAVVATPATSSAGYVRSEKSTKMTPMRMKIAQRLKDSQEVAASLTTFNEVDMSALVEMRSLYKDEILKKHGVKFGFMSPFIKAAATVMQELPMVNARIENGDTIVQPNFVDISIAVATPKGLLTPVLRDCQTMSMIELEAAMARISEKARAGQISMADLAGGTFTISNGGVFGSLMGTPIINMPQSAILGMHAIKERPIALNGQVVIRPMMNLALTYDHRIIDGREAVTFLVRLKQLLEDPRRLLLQV